jgi:hypothetical protein
MTDNNGNDRRRDIDGRIDTLGTGTNGVSGRRGADRVGDRSRADGRTDDDEGQDASLTDDEEAESEAETDSSTDAEVDEESDGEDDADTFEAESTDIGIEDEEELYEPEDDEDESDDASVENRTDNVDQRSSLEVEIDPFVRAYAARRSAEMGEESLDEYIVGSVKGYLAGLLGGDVASPGTLEREVETNADPIFGGLLDTIAGENESAADVVIEAVAESYDVPLEEDSLVVAGLRDHEALLNGVVANNSNDLGDVSEVVQAAVETRLIEEPAE